MMFFRSWWFCVALWHLLLRHDVYGQPVVSTANPSHPRNHDGSYTGTDAFSLVYPVSSSSSSLSIDDHIHSMHTTVETDQSLNRVRLAIYNTYQSLIQCISLYELIPVMTNISTVRLTNYGQKSLPSTPSFTSILSSSPAPASAPGRSTVGTVASLGHDDTIPSSTASPPSFITRRHETLSQMQFRTTQHLLSLIIKSRNNAILNQYLILEDTGIVVDFFQHTDASSSVSSSSTGASSSSSSSHPHTLLPTLPGIDIAAYLTQLRTFTIDNHHHDSEGMYNLIIHTFEEILYHKYPHISKDIIHLLLHLQESSENKKDNSSVSSSLSNNYRNYGTVPFDEGLTIILHKQQQQQPYSSVPIPTPLPSAIPSPTVFSTENNPVLPSASSSVHSPVLSSSSISSTTTTTTATTNLQPLSLDEVLKLAESLIDNNQIQFTFDQDTITFEPIKANNDNTDSTESNKMNIPFQIFTMNATDSSFTNEKVKEFINFISTNLPNLPTYPKENNGDTANGITASAVTTEITSTPTPVPSPSPYPEYPEVPPGVDTPLAVNNLLQFLHVPSILSPSSFDTLSTVPTKDEAKLFHQQLYATASQTVVNPWDYSVGDYVRNDIVPTASSSPSRLSSSPFSRFKRSVFQLNRTEIVLARSKREKDRLRLTELGLPIATGMVPHTSAYSSNIEFAMAEALRRSFEHAWYAYTQAGYGTDIYHPLSNTTGGDLCKMGETLIDGLDTALLMGLSEPYDRAKEWVTNILPTLVGGQTDINLFECTIRVVGGLLAVYDLSRETVFLNGAELVMQAMIDTGAFLTPTGLPYGTLYLTPRTTDPVSLQRIIDTTVTVPDNPGIGIKTNGGYAYNPTWTDGSSSISEVSTLQLELAALSYHTGNDTYRKLGQRIMYHLYNKSTYDGLYPYLIDPHSGLLKDVVVTLGARGDSLYEYMLKQWLYAGGWSYEEERAPIMADLVTNLLMPIWEKEQYCIYWNSTENGSSPGTEDDRVVSTEETGTIEENTDTDNEINDGETIDETLLPSSPIDILAPPAWIIPPIPDADPTFAVQRIEQAQRTLEYLQRTNENNPRYLLKMYNKAVRGIMDRLRQYSTPSNYTYVAESSHTVNVMPDGQDPTLIPKMDHLVCFLPGVIGLGIQYDAGHENLARYKETSLRTIAIIHALDTYQNRTERFWFTENTSMEPNVNTENTATTVPTDYALIFDTLLPVRYNSSTARTLIVRILQSMDYVIMDVNRGYTISQAIESSNFYQFNMRNTSICPEILAAMQPVSTTTTTTKTTDDDGTVTTSDNAATIDEATATPSSSPSPSPLPAAFYRSFFPDPVLDPFGSLTDPFVTKQQLLETAKGLTHTCHLMYSRTTTGLAPEIISFTPGADFKPNHDARHCLLRPETVESLFILYRITNDTIYQDWAWEIYDSLELHARVRTGGYASVKDVDTSGLDPQEGLVSLGKANMNDKMESFFLAETLKYLYLLFTPYSEQLLPLDNYVFNTEAHPLRIPKSESKERRFPTQWWKKKI